MKRLLFLTTSLAVLSLSCNKSHNTGSAYYIKATIDGVSKNFAGNVSATSVADIRGNAININGLFSSANGEGLNVEINSYKPNVYVTPGLYTDTSSTYNITLTYVPAPTLAAYSSGTITSDSAARHGITIVNHLKVAINAMTSTDITGSFEGDIFLNGDATASKKLVTDGTFFAKFQ